MDCKCAALPKQAYYQKMGPLQYLILYNAFFENYPELFVILNKNYYFCIR